MKSSGFNGILNPVWNATLIDQWCSVCLKRQWHVLYSLLLTASFGFHKGAKLLEEYHLPLHYKIMGLKWRKRFYSRGPRGFSPCQSTSTSILLQAQSSGVVFGVIDSRSSLTESQWELEIMHFDIYHRFQLRKTKFSDPEYLSHVKEGPKKARYLPNIEITDLTVEGIRFRTFFGSKLDEFNFSLCRHLLYHVTRLNELKSWTTLSIVLRSEEHQWQKPERWWVDAGC